MSVVVTLEQTSDLPVNFITAIGYHMLVCNVDLPDRQLVEETSLLKAVQAVCIYLNNPENHLDALAGEASLTARQTQSRRRDLNRGLDLSQSKSLYECTCSRQHLCGVQLVVKKASLYLIYLVLLWVGRDAAMLFRLDRAAIRPRLTLYRRCSMAGFRAHAIVRNGLQSVLFTQLYSTSQYTK